MASYFHEIDPTQFKRYWLDVSYADHDPRQKMDIWLPDEAMVRSRLSCSSMAVAGSAAISARIPCRELLRLCLKVTP